VNSIYFTTQKELAESALLSVITKLGPAKQIVWLDTVNTENVGDKDTIFAAKKIGNGQHRYRYEIFLRDYTTSLSLREKVDWLKYLATTLQIEVLTPDEEVDPYTYILIDKDKTYPVEVNPDLFNENDELTISGAYHSSLGGFATEKILTQSEEKAFLQELCKPVPLCELVQYEPGLLPHDFNLNKKNFPQLQLYDHLYLIIQSGNGEWLSKDEKSKQLTDVLTLFHTKTKVNVCLFPPNSVTVENIPGGSDSEAFCICIDKNGMRKIIYKVRKTSW
jgi:hypothetical protein